MANPFFEHPILNSPYDAQRGIGNLTSRAADAADYRDPPPGRVHHAHSQAEEA